MCVCVCACVCVRFLLLVFLLSRLLHAEEFSVLIVSQCVLFFLEIFDQSFLVLNVIFCSLSLHAFVYFAYHFACMHQFCVKCCMTDING